MVLTLDSPQIPVNLKKFIDHDHDLLTPLKTFKSHKRTKLNFTLQKIAAAPWGRTKRWNGKQI